MQIWCHSTPDCYLSHGTMTEMDSGWCLFILYVPGKKSVVEESRFRVDEVELFTNAFDRI